MILFMKDWLKYPTAIVDKDTKNKSWYRMALVFRSMGIKNHAFLLALVNPLLRGIDPHSPFLTREQMDMIAAECFINPWYFFREVARIPAQNGKPPVMVEANRGNIALWWCFFNHVIVALIQPRQTGKSFSVDELVALLMNVLCEDTLINLYTKDHKLRVENVIRIKEIINVLPAYMIQRQPGIDSDNQEEITVGELNNRYATHVPRSSEKDANNVGRGFTSPINLCDEPPFAKNSHISIPALLSSGNKARENAKEAGTPYGTIFTTTAGKLNEKEGEAMYALLQKSMVWDEAVYDCEDEDDLRVFVKKSGRGEYRVNITLSHRQLGKTDEWLREAMLETGSVGDAADRDYFNRWTSGTETHPLSSKLLRRITESLNEAGYTQAVMPERYTVRWQMPSEAVNDYMRNNDTVLCVDSSDASGGDDIGMVWLDCDNLEVAAVANINETNILHYCAWVTKMLVMYPRTTLMLERKSTGPAIFDIITEMLLDAGEDPFRRMFNLVVQDASEDPDRFETIRVPLARRDERVYTVNKKTFGFNTSGSGRFSRQNLYNIGLQMMAKLAGDRVYDKVLIDQISGLTQKDNRIDHAADGNDDLVIAWLLGYWFLSNGRNLSWYGIEKVMTNVEIEQELTPEEQLEQYRQKRIQLQLKDLSDRLAAETDDYASQYIEHEMRVLSKNVVYTQGSVNSIDQLINEIKEKKRTKRRLAGQNYGRDQAMNDSEYYKHLYLNVNRNSY